MRSSSFILQRFLQAPLFTLNLVIRMHDDEPKQTSVDPPLERLQPILRGGFPGSERAGVLPRPRGPAACFTSSPTENRSGKRETKRKRIRLIYFMFRFVISAESAT